MENESGVSTTSMTEAENAAHTAAMFERLLTADEPSSDNQKKPKSEAGETPEAEAVEAEAESPDGTEETPEADEAESDGSAETSEDEGEAESKGKVTFTVKVDDKDMTFTEDELPNLIMMRSDYSRKTQALAEERKAFQDEARKVKEERDQYSQILPALAQQIQAYMPALPDPALIDTDPAAYLKAERKYQFEMERLQAANAEFERVQSQKQQDALNEMRAYVEQAFQRLPEYVPEWRDSKIFERDKPKLREYGVKLGYSEDELNQATDPRAVAALYKAMKYDELISRKPRPDAPIEKVVRPNPAPPSTATPRKTRDAQVARDRLARTGKVEDAAAAIRSLL